MNSFINLSYFATAAGSLLTLGMGSTAQAELSLPDGRHASIGDMLFPSAHVIISGGDSSEDAEELAVGAHDPNDDFNVQAIELGLSLRLGDHIEGFANYLFSYGDSEWEDENEEAYASIKDLPGNVTIRGGRFINRFGLFNNMHQHEWKTVDMPLASGRILGEEHLITEGLDITWHLPGLHDTALTVSFGEPRDHEGHAHAEDDNAEEEIAEEAAFNDDFFTANLSTLLAHSDNHEYRAGGSIAQGDNELGDDTLLAGLHLSCRWFEDGDNVHGKLIAWNTELFYRDISAGDHDHAEEAEEHAEELEGSVDEWAFYTEVMVRPVHEFETGLRVSFIDDVEELGLGQRTRVSPWATRYFGHTRNYHVRVQYNYDDLADGDAHSVWLQLQYSFGDEEGHECHH